MQIEPINSELTEDFWRNVPTVDATEMMVLFPKKIDLEKARPGDPENCVYARCVKRVIPSARRVRIWRGIALVESKNKKGETVALRYIISNSGKKALRKFDQGIGEIHSCTLLPPTPSTSLEGERKRAEKQRGNQAYLDQKKEIQRNKAAGIHKPNRTTKHQGDYLVRNGSGHFRLPIIINE
jgi:hypothetical protein